MATIQLESGMLSFPAEDISLVKSLAKKFGWKFSRKKKCGLDEAIDDIKAGRVRGINDIDEYFKELGVNV